MSSQSSQSSVLYLASFADYHCTEEVARSAYHALAASDRHVVRFQSISLEDVPSSLQMTRSTPYAGTRLSTMGSDPASARLEAVTNLRLLTAMTSADTVLCTTPGMQAGTDPAAPRTYADLAADFQANTLVVVPADHLDDEQLRTSIRACVSFVRGSGAKVVAVIVADGGRRGFGETDDVATTVNGGAGTPFKSADDLPILWFDTTDDSPTITSDQASFLRSLTTRENPVIVTPSTFQFGLLDRAKANHKTIVLPEGDEERILAAANYLLERDVVKILLCGDPATIRSHAEQLGFHAVAEKAEIQTFNDADLLGRMAEELVRARAGSRTPPTLDQALSLVRQPSYFGTMCVQLGLADGMVSGAVHSTADTVRPALQIIRPRPDHRIASGAMIMCLDHRIDLYADVALMPNPTAMQLAEVARESAATARLFGINPVVGLLSYSTGHSGKGPDVDLVRNATEITRSANPDLPVTGPIQFDAAWSPEVARIKTPDDPAAGHVNVFVLPDLSASNVAVKAVQRVGGALAIGPILQGLNKPINDLSRGATIRDIINTIAVTAIEA